MADIVLNQQEGVQNAMQTRYQDMLDGTHALVIANGANVRTAGADASATNPLPVDVRTVTEATWTTLLADTLLDGTPAVVNSNSLDVSGQGALWMQIFIDSVGAPTDARIIAQFSHNNGANWSDFVEGLWSSLYWEDTATAASIRQMFLLPCGGQDLVRFRVVTTGTAPGATFTIGIRARAFRGNFGVGHA